MSPTSDHPDTATLRAWIARTLAEDQSEDVKRHVETCTQCAASVDRFESAALESTQRDEHGLGFAERLRAIARGESVPEQIGKKIELADDEAGNLEGGADGDTVRADATQWQQACTSTSNMTQTIKVDSTDELSSLELPIKQRSLLSSETSAAEDADYRLLNEIGHGGMGVVYSAQQSSMDRLVAIKMLKNVDGNRDRRRLFLQEAVVTADLDHPNIVPIHELGGNEQGALFYSMKQVQGTSWKEVIDSNSEQENLDILMRVADAVAFAHSRGIVHRDLKPENVMLGQFGEAWLMDWGLAFPTEDCPKPNVIRSPRLGGTPAYMAPEMTARTDEITPVTDVYLLGAILFQIVTGAPPHRGASVMQCILAARQNRITATTLRSGLLTIARRSMETKPSDRYQSVLEFQAAVRKWMTHNDSLKMAENSRVLLEEAKTDGSYQDFVRSIFGFEQAHALFPENGAFAESIANAKFAYASCAEKNSDFDLSASLLDPHIPLHAEMLTRVNDAKREQDVRAVRLQNQQRAFRVLVAVTLSLILGSIGVAQWLRSSSLQLANTNEPAMHASLSLQSGLRRSLSALRGWVALGDADFKADRAVAWNKEIDPALQRLYRLTALSGTEEDRQNLADLHATLDDLYATQWWIEDVAQTPGNEPSRNLLLRDIVPVESDIASALESLVELEQEKSSFKDEPPIWPEIAELQLDFAKCHRRLSAFIETGDEVSRVRFETWLSRVGISLDRLIESNEQLSDQQQALTAWLRDEFNVYSRLAQSAVVLRDSDQADVAQWRLKTEAIPASDSAETSLLGIVARYRTATNKNSRQINAVSALAVSIGIAVAIGIVVVTWFMVLGNRSARGARLSRSPIVTGLLAIAWFAITATPAQAQAAVLPTKTIGGAEQRTPDDEVESADVYRRLMQVVGELELIRSEMGKPKYEMTELSVSDVYPHEVYFQALTMDRKSDQLCFELIRSRAPSPVTPETIGPTEVMIVIDSVGQRMETLIQKLGITERSELPPRDATKTPTDVFRAIVKANRQLNLLVEKRFSSSDVFQQVTLAVGYCSELLTLFPEATRLPDAPAFVSGMTPADVAMKLDACFGRIRSIASKSNVRMLTFQKRDRGESLVEPSDVYDLASLLVSELAHLHSLHGQLRRPRRVFAPGPLFPSHAYQRAGLFESQLVQLEKLVEQNPAWLRSSVHAD